MKLKIKLLFYNVIMFIIPLIASVLVFEIAVIYLNNNFFTNTGKNRYLSYGSNTIIEYLENMEGITLNGLETTCNTYNFSLSIKDENNDFYFSNMSSDEKSIIDNLTTLENKNIIYQVEGRTVITQTVSTADGRYMIYIVSKANNIPTVSIALLRIVLLIALFVPFVTVVVSNFIISNKLASSITSPLKSLAQSANRIRRGDLNLEVENADYEELNELCIAFNAMRLQLKENVDKNVLYENNRQELIAGISHDLKTPLTVIQGYAKGLLDGVANDEQKRKQYLDTIYRKSFEMESLLNQLTLFSKLETKSLVFNFEKRNLHEYLQSVVKQLKNDYVNNNFLINYNNRCKMIYVNIDTQQMNRVLTNIISNSIKYNDKETIVIDMNCYMNEDEEIIISISDNGIGVSEENLKNIFDSFYRVDSARSTRIEGNGLGLSISRYIVEAHNGQISANSEKGKGLTINIILPKEEKDAIK